MTVVGGACGRGAVDCRPWTVDGGRWSVVGVLARLYSLRRCHCITARFTSKAEVEDLFRTGGRQSLCDLCGLCGQPSRGNYPPRRTPSTRRTGAEATHPKSSIGHENERRDTKTIPLL
jgi:hypothetical protein